MQLLTRNDAFFVQAACASSAWKTETFCIPQGLQAKSWPGQRQLTLTIWQCAHSANPLVHNVSCSVLLGSNPLCALRTFLPLLGICSKSQNVSWHAVLVMNPDFVCILQISRRGEVFSGIVLGLSKYGLLSVPAVFGCLRRAMCSPLTSLAMANLHAACYACGAVVHSNVITELQASLEEVYMASGISFTSILPQVGDSEAFGHQSL